MVIKWIAQIIVAFNSNVKRTQIAAGISCGLLLALVPAGNLLWIVLFLLFFLTKAHYGMGMIAMALVKLLGFLTSPALDAIGWAALNAKGLQPLFKELYAMPIAPLTRFYNTLVMGGFVSGMLLWLPVFFLSLGLVTIYRAKLAPAISNSKLTKAFLKLPLISSLAKAVGTLSGLAKAGR